MMNTYTIHPLQTARATRPTVMHTYLRNINEITTLFYGAFLLKSENRNILVDTGCDALNYSAGPYSSLEDVASLEQNLGRFGLDIDKIDAVILTHLHFDHIAFLNRFHHCPKFVQKRELSSALNPHPYFSSFYVPRFFENINLEIIDGDRLLFPGIDVAMVPGHSAGCQAVIVETNEGLAAVSGFCCVAQNFEKNNIAVPGIHENFSECYDSMFKLMGLVDIVYANHSSEPVSLKRG